jgi:hypothetical protein
MVECAPKAGAAFAAGGMSRASVQRQSVGEQYLYAGVLICSAWSLRALPGAADMVSHEPSISIGRLDAQPCKPSKTDWLHHWPPEGAGMSLSREGEGYLLRFRDLADFVISADGRRIEAWPAPATDAETLDHLLLDQVMPRILAQQGRLVLHAGAVQVTNHAIAFLGDTGSGKSTLTASLHAGGYPLLCDDGLVLTQAEGTTLALPTYPSLRLWPDAISGLYKQAPALAPMAHYSSKRRIVMTETVAKTDSSLALAALYVLSPGTSDASISLRRLSPSEACMVIIGNSFQLDVTDRRGAVELFALASNIAEHLPVFSLAYPRDFARLPEVHEAILMDTGVTWSGPTLQCIHPGGTAYDADR